VWSGAFWRVAPSHLLRYLRTHQIYAQDISLEPYLKFRRIELEISHLVGNRSRKVFREQIPLQNPSLARPLPIASCEATVTLHLPAHMFGMLKWRKTHSGKWHTRPGPSLRKQPPGLPPLAYAFPFVQCHILKMNLVLSNKRGHLRPPPQRSSKEALSIRNIPARPPRVYRLANRSDRDHDIQSRHWNESLQST